MLGFFPEDSYKSAGPLQQVGQSPACFVHASNDHYRDNSLGPISSAEREFVRFENVISILSSYVNTYLDIFT